MEQEKRPNVTAREYGAAHLRKSFEWLAGHTRDGFSRIEDVPDTFDGCPCSKCTRERYVGKYNEATGQFDLVAPTEPNMRDTGLCPVCGGIRPSHTLEQWRMCPGIDKREDPNRAVLRKHWESMGNL